MFKKNDLVYVVKTERQSYSSDSVSFKWIKEKTLLRVVLAHANSCDCAPADSFDQHPIRGFNYDELRKY